MESFGYRKALRGERTVRRRAPYLFEERVLLAHQRFHCLHKGRYNDSERSEYPMKRLLPIAAAGVLVLALMWAALKTAKVAREIRRQSTVDEVQPADVIVVLGAAEYHGRPSPVFRARLDHALFLYLEGMAPRVLTTGGRAAIRHIRKVKWRTLT